jgi:hypothetical protein
MAMCNSGSLGMISAPQGGCSSISLAVCGSAQASSLCSMSLAAGKIAPHAMSEFHGYAPIIPIRMCQTGGGNCGTAYATNIGCLTPAISVVGDCYCVCFCTHMCVTTGGVGYSQIIIQRAGTNQLSCCITAGQACINPSVSFLVSNGQAVNINLYACKSCPGGCCGGSSACVCLNSITSVVGCYSAGTPANEIAVTN